MAVAVNTEHAQEVGNDIYAYGDITGDASYPTGGYQLPALAADGQQMATVRHLVANPVGGFVPQFDRANQKLNSATSTVQTTMIIRRRRTISQ